MNYRILPHSEWDRLRAFVEPHGPTPPPEVAMAAVAEEDGKIVGALFLQIALHMEPLVIQNPRVNFLRLQRTLTEAALPPDTPYHVFVGDEKVKKMVEVAGLKPTGYSAWQGRS